MEENSEQAEKLLRKAMSHKKHSVSVINNLAVLLMEKESYREAIEILNLSSDRDYESKILLYSRSYGRFMTNRYSELIAETDSDTEIVDYPRLLMGLVSCIEINDKNKTLFFPNKDVTATTGNILVLNDSRITADHIVTEVVWGNSSYITSDVTWTTAAGSLTLNGTCTTATTVTVTLVKKDN